MAAGTIPNEVPNLVMMLEQYLIFAYDIWLTSMHVIPLDPLKVDWIQQRDMEKRKKSVSIRDAHKLYTMKIISSDIWN